MYIALVCAVASSTGITTECTGFSSALPAAECAAFVSLFDATNGPGWKQCSGNRTDPCACGRDTGWDYCGPPFGNNSHIVVLPLASNQLQGTVPAGISALTELTWLGLEFNAISGTIPTSLGKLESLRLLSLEHNQLSGTIPTEIAKLRKLETMDLELNQLSGTIPPVIGDMHSVLRIDLLSNALTGRMPELPWSQYTYGCWLGDNAFTCPLPHGARSNCTGDGHHPPTCIAPP